MKGAGAVPLLLRESLAFDFLQQVCQCFASSPELGVALVLHVELLLQRGREAQGKQQVERIMAGTGGAAGHVVGCGPEDRARRVGAACCCEVSRGWIQSAGRSHDGSSVTPRLAAVVG